MPGLSVRPVRSGLQQAFTLPALATRHLSVRWRGLYFWRQHANIVV
jgi:hypothetical protein